MGGVLGSIQESVFRIENFGFRMEDGKRWDADFILNSDS